MPSDEIAVRRMKLAIGKVAGNRTTSYIRRYPPMDIEEPIH